ncbi:hypothetical protein BKA62DRAFT_775623 [Auriculariales sp. MPI-PUGE-AT-0066]|nr:hypothetical protein BKA62DRAFT_775623 [Auriculariales sp. MPI-PUGE-AT-0066]
MDASEPARTTIQTFPAGQWTSSTLPETNLHSDALLAAFVFTGGLLAGRLVRQYALRRRKRLENARATRIGLTESQSPLEAPAEKSGVEPESHVVPTAGDVVFVALALTCGVFLGRWTSRYYEQRQHVLDNTLLATQTAISRPEESG